MVAGTSIGAQTLAPYKIGMTFPLTGPSVPPLGNTQPNPSGPYPGALLQGVITFCGPLVTPYGLELSQA